VSYNFKKSTFAGNLVVRFAVRHEGGTALNTANDVSEPAGKLAQVRSVPPFRPFTWLSRGWDDLLHHRAGSLAYGALISALGGLTLMYQRNPLFLAAVMSAVMLVGPLMAAGLCELSRGRSRGEVSNFDTSLKTLARHRQSLSRLAVTLLLLNLAWFLVAGMALQAAFGSIGPSLTDTVWGDVLHNLSTTQLLAYLLIGGSLASIVFALSVVTVPMIVDRDVDASTAMRTSLRVAVVADLPAIIVWGTLCMLLVGIGLATYMVGMVLIFPLLGHATWYAYLDLVA
jgi:uncharacterized membrane protein